MLMPKRTKYRKTQRGKIKGTYKRFEVSIHTWYSIARAAEATIYPTHHEIAA